MSVTPAAEPVPALSHRLATPDIDLIAGNAAPYYYRALLDLPRLMKSIRDKFDEEEELSRWYATGTEAAPIAELPLDRVREASQMFDPVISNHLTEAMKRRDCDWQLGVEEMRGPQLISVHLEEFQNSRELARMLALETRLAIAERRYDDALRTMRMNLRLGRDVSTEPFFVCGLIGIAIGGVTHGTATELVAAPDSPNLYWALGELPQPLIDLRQAARFEADFGPRIFPFIHNAETAVRSAEEWNRLFRETVRDLAFVGDSSDDIWGGFPRMSPHETAVAIALAGYPHAKRWLIEHGMDHERVEDMAVGHVIAIYSERIYKRNANQFENLWYVPYSELRKQADIGQKAIEDSRRFSASDNREILPISSLLIPAMQWVRTAQARLDRDIAALRVIESLRMHAALHDGRLPETLDDIDCVPVPENPVTGNVFQYHLAGQTGILELPASDGIPNYTRRYEIKLAPINAN
jgi:hypothetical protein